MVRALILAVLMLAVPGMPRAQGVPGRVVSLNLCTDQLAMMLARPGQLVAVSQVARDPVSSALWREAADWPAHNGQAEAIHLLNPDLVLAGEFDPPATLALLRRLGLRVETFALESGFDDIRANVTRMGGLLGASDRAAALLADMERTLQAEARPGPPPRAALFYSNGYTSGTGTLAHEILTAAGYANIAAERGYGGLTRLPLEVLVMEQPDLLVTGQDYAAPALAQTILHHPAALSLTAGRASIADNLWVCGTPLAAEAVAGLRAALPR